MRLYTLYIHHTYVRYMTYVSCSTDPIHQPSHGKVLVSLVIRDCSNVTESIACGRWNADWSVDFASDSSRSGSPDEAREDPASFGWSALESATVGKNVGGQTRRQAPQSLPPHWQAVARHRDIHIYMYILCIYLSIYFIINHYLKNISIYSSIYTLYIYTYIHMYT